MEGLISKSLEQGNGVPVYFFQSQSLRGSGKKEDGGLRPNASEVKTAFFAYEKASGQAMGIAGIKELQSGVYTVTDIAIGPDFAGRVYGKQVLNAMTALAFGTCKAKALYYECFAQNERSRRLELSCGFVYTHSEEELLGNGEKVVLDHFVKRG